ncbi:MAG: hypothetical protein ABI818_18065, partial [Acidobacteriota bacterium]
RAGWEDTQRPVLPASLELAVIDAGQPPPNLAVTGVQIEKDRVVASLRATGAAPRTGQVRVELDGRVVASGPYRISGDATLDVPIPYRSPGAGGIAVTVDDPAGFAADNTRYAVLERSHSEPVLVVTSGEDRSGFFLSRALASASDGPEGAMAVRVVDGSTLAREELAKSPAVALLSTRGFDRRAREAIAAYVRAGGGLFVAAAPDVEPVVLSTVFDWRPAVSGIPPDAGEPLSLSVTDLRHPIFRRFGALVANLGQVKFDRSWRVREDGWDVIARFTNGSPALLERREGAGRVVLFTSDIDRRWNDFPSHPAFVPFAVEAIRYVATVRDRAQDYLVSRVPPGAEPRPGLYHVKPEGRTIAVNVDPRESTGETVRPEEIEGLLDRVSTGAGAAMNRRAQQAEARQSYWQYGLLLMLAALVAESLMGRA